MYQRVSFFASVILSLKVTSTRLIRFFSLQLVWRFGIFNFVMMFKMYTFNCKLLNYTYIDFLQKIHSRLHCSSFYPRRCIYTRTSNFVLNCYYVINMYWSTWSYRRTQLVFAHIVIVVVSVKFFISKNET